MLQIGRKAGTWIDGPGQYQQPSVVRRANADLDRVWENELRVSNQNNFRSRFVQQSPTQSSKTSAEQDPTTPADAVSGAKLQARLQALANLAQNLNELSDRLTQQVGEIENAVNKLNLGVNATIEVECSSDDEGESVQITEIGYAKVGGKWGFTIELYDAKDLENRSEVWPFKDAPRDLRLKAVERIPLLLDELVTRSIKLASDITTKVTFATYLVSSLPQPGPSGSKK